ncbi:hypothetical protein [Mesorhizobium opportunistum]|nr:hypothetical protein [Mesorhizobium opportunistum]
MKMPPDLALGGARFKEELPDTARAAGIFVWLVRSLAGFARLLSLLAVMR